MKIYFPGGLCCLALCCSALAQNANTTAASSATAGQYTNADIAKALNVVKTNIVWQDSSFLKNVQVCWVMGEPNKENLIVELVKFPAHYQLPEHSHPYAELISVISGTYWSAQGIDKDGLKFQAGESYIMPADCVHHAWTGDEETILQLVFTGPAKLVFANPADDPRQASNK